MFSGNKNRHKKLFVIGVKVKMLSPTHFLNHSQGRHSPNDMCFPRERTRALALSQNHCPVKGITHHYFIEETKQDRNQAKDGVE